MTGSRLPIKFLVITMTYILRKQIGECWGRRFHPIVCPQPHPIVGMPSLDLYRLVELLSSIESNLYRVWIDCKNNDLCTSIERERARLERIIDTITPLLSPRTEEEEPIDLLAAAAHPS